MQLFHIIDIRKWFRMTLKSFEELFLSNHNARKSTLNVSVFLLIGGESKVGRKEGRRKSGNFRELIHWSDKNLFLIHIIHENKKQKAAAREWKANRPGLRFITA